MTLSISDHEKKLLDFYDHDPDRYRVTNTIPGKGVFVLFTNRSGSNLLVDLLRQQETLSLQLEIFNADEVMLVSQKNGFSSFNDYVHFWRAQKKLPCWGAKIGCIQLRMLHRFGLTGAFENGFYLVWLKRKNIVAQAVSHFIANHNKAWTSFHAYTDNVPAYDYAAIAGIVNAILREQSDTELVLALTGVKYTGLWYEEFLEHPHMNVRKVSRIIDEPLSPVNLKRTSFKKQAHPAKEDYENRFKEEALARIGLGENPYLQPGHLV